MNALSELSHVSSETDCKNISIDDIRNYGQKPEYRTAGNFLACKWARPSAVYGTWMALRIGLSAHQITTLAALSWFAEALCISIGTRFWFSIGVTFGFLGFWLDHVDGQLARITKTQSLEGIFLDFWVHTAHAILRAFGLGWGLYQITGNDLAILSGMGAAFGWAMISHSNDSKYKAMNAYLQSEKTSYMTQSKDQTFSPSIPIFKNPSNLLTLINWPLLKMQEPHMVLMAELIICLLMWFSLQLGIKIWLLGMIFWSTVSPLCAIFRLIRYVKSGQITVDFFSTFSKQSGD